MHRLADVLEIIIAVLPHLWQQILHIFPDVDSIVDFVRDRDVLAFSFSELVKQHDLFADFIAWFYHISRNHNKPIISFLRRRCDDLAIVA